MNEIKINNLEQTCFACPSQWEGRTEDDEYVYIRYRYGILSWKVGDSIKGEIYHGGEMDGVMDTGTMIKLTDFTVKDHE